MGDMWERELVSQASREEEQEVVSDMLRGFLESVSVVRKGYLR